MGGGGGGGGSGRKQGGRGRGVMRMTVRPATVAATRFKLLWLTEEAYFLHTSCHL